MVTCGVCGDLCVLEEWAQEALVLPKRMTRLLVVMGAEVSKVRGGQGMS